MARVKLDSTTEWLLRQAADDDGGAVSAGGLASRLGMLNEPYARESAFKTAFAKLVELRRRERGLSVEGLSAKTGVRLADLLAVECEPDVPTDPLVIACLAKELGLPAERLLQLAGVSKPNDAVLEQAAIRFAARAKPADDLTCEEHEALTELVKVMCQ